MFVVPNLYDNHYVRYQLRNDDEFVEQTKNRKIVTGFCKGFLKGSLVGGAISLGILRLTRFPIHPVLHVYTVGGMFV